MLCILFYYLLFKVINVSSTSVHTGIDRAKKFIKNVIQIYHNCIIQPFSSDGHLGFSGASVK